MPFHGICAWPWPGLASLFSLFVLTLCGLNLDMNLHEFFVKASWYFGDLGISGQLLGIPWIRSASVHHFNGLNLGMIFPAKFL